MADLGAIGKSPSPSHVTLYGGYIAGTVFDGSGNPTKHPVRAYHKVTGQLSGGTFSDPTTGAYTLYTGIAFGQTAHFVMESDPTLTQNARIFDNVIPYV